MYICFDYLLWLPPLKAQYQLLQVTIVTPSMRLFADHKQPYHLERRKAKRILNRGSKGWLSKIKLCLNHFWILQRELICINTLTSIALLYHRTNRFRCWHHWALKSHNNPRKGMAQWRRLSKDYYYYYYYYYYSYYYYRWYRANHMTRSWFH